MPPMMGMPPMNNLGRGQNQRGALFPPVVSTMSDMSLPPPPLNVLRVTSGVSPLQRKQ
jgi:hypothetical protein